MNYSDAFGNLMILEEYTFSGKPPWGITQSIFDSWCESKGIGHHDAMNTTRGLASDFAFDEYWIPSGCGSLPDKLDFVVFQASYNIGQERAIGLLQESLGVTVDGLIGPVTLKAANRADVVETCKLVLSYQNKYYCSIESEKNKVNENGWHNRVTRTTSIIGVTL